MLTLTATVKVYVAPGTTDMRKSFDALSGVVSSVLREDPVSGHVFAFCGRRRHIIKLLVWDGTGLWVFAKRLARGRFSWPEPPTDGRRCLVLRPEELALLLGGVDLRKVSLKRWWGRTPAIAP